MIGTQGSVFFLGGGPGGTVGAVDENTGDLVSSTQLDPDPAAIITQSATIHAGVVQVGIASQEEALAALVPRHPCWSFQGSLAALDLSTGEILWQTYMAPAGYGGNAIRGSSPAIDVRRRSIYVAAGNNYSVPPDVLACVDAAGDEPDLKPAALAADGHVDSALSLDMDIGAIEWATRALPYDA